MYVCVQLYLVQYFSHLHNESLSSVKTQFVVLVTVKALHHSDVTLYIIFLFTYQLIYKKITYGSNIYTCDGPSSYDSYDHMTVT